MTPQILGTDNVVSTAARKQGPRSTTIPMTLGIDPENVVSTCAEEQKPSHQLRYYYGPPLTARNLRWLHRRSNLDLCRAVRPLLTLLTQLLKDIQAYTESLKVKNPASAFSATLQSGIAQQEKRSKETDKSSSFEDLGNADLELHDNGSFKQCNVYEDSPIIDLQQYLETDEVPPGEGTFANILGQIIKKKLPTNARYISRRIICGTEVTVAHLLNCPDALEREINKALIAATERKRTGTRKRSRRSGKRIQRKRLNAAKRLDAWYCCGYQNCGPQCDG